jgi:ATP-dependent exoDNAse (exonuclease V) beta subunit
MSTNIRFISAGAGSGKTYRLTAELADALTGERARPDGVIGTTFTIRAANELRERVRQSLIETGNIRLANKMGQALLGTVNSVCGRLLEQFAFEAGLPPNLEVLPEGDDQLLFNQAIEASISVNDVRLMNDLSHRLGFEDWRNEVKDIVNKTRANNMQPGELLKFGPRNADGLLSFFPDPTRRNLWTTLFKAVDRAIEEITANDDATVGTKNYLNELIRLKPLIKNKQLIWSQWVKLSKAQPTNKSKPLAEPVTNTVLQYDQHPLLHKDIRQFCEIIFRLAADSLKQYQALKRKRGLIDFVDQEQLMLNALSRPDIFQTLTEELDLLLVDEFQDTSPIQLALFLKLAEAANETVFVGDVKQAIYGFRGSDPALMQAVLHEVQAQGGVTDVLKTSWRSRPALIAYTNNIFAPAFADTIPSDQVMLKPEHKEETGEPAVEHWILKGRNAPVRAAGLAAGINELVESRYQVVDKTTRILRPVQFEDIAVLARTNVHVGDIAHALAAAGIPIQMARSGLLGTPEACLALACLRRMADPRDTLASAEIMALSDCAEPEAWLKNRLKYLQSDRPGHLWGEAKGFEHPVIQALAEHRDRLQHLTPSEAVAYSINVSDLRRIVTSWGPNQWKVRQRLQNLDALAAFAREYEAHCRTQRRSATIAGLIVWLNELGAADLDSQPGDPKSNAVHVLTHHGAKGLEWPVIIATDLNSNIKTRLWGSNVVSETDRINLSNPLSDRFVRFWPFPFGGQQKGMQVVDQIKESDIGQECRTAAVEEIRRLLYVSLTRARDLLIIPLPDKKTTGPWMGTLQADWMLPAGDKLILPDKTKIPTANRVFDATEADATLETGGYKPFWLGPRTPASDKLPAIMNPSSMEKVPGSKIVGTQNVGMQLKLKGSPAMNQVGLALHQLIAAEIINPAHEDALLTAKQILEGHEVPENIDSKAAVAYVQHFIKYANTTFQASRILTEYPVTQVLDNNQLMKGWIDMLMETDQGWVIVDHKFTSQPESELEKEALKYSGQILAYKNAVEAATSKKIESCWIHFPNSGVMLQLMV